MKLKRYFLYYMSCFNRPTWVELDDREMAKAMIKYIKDHPNASPLYLVVVRERF